MSCSNQSISVINLLGAAGIDSYLLLGEIVRQVCNHDLGLGRDTIRWRTALTALAGLSWGLGCFLSIFRSSSCVSSGGSLFSCGSSLFLGLTFSTSLSLILELAVAKTLVVRYASHLRHERYVHRDHHDHGHVHGHGRMACGGPHLQRHPRLRLQHPRSSRQLAQACEPVGRRPCGPGSPFLRAQRWRVQPHLGWKDRRKRIRQGGRYVGSLG